MEHSSPQANGVLLIDKTAGCTSHDAVAQARRALGMRKVGHAGTLDPMATGLLMLGVGASTRLLTYLVGLDKTYTATVRLGIATVTDDREGERVRVAAPAQVRALAAEPARIAAAVKQLRQVTMQQPSSVSAIKVSGRRAYDRVRAGEAVALPQRPITIFRFESGPPRLSVLPGSIGHDPVAVIDLEVTVHCSSGTYVRALARDLGAALGVGGHLTALRRHTVGPFTLASAVPQLALGEHQDTIHASLLAPAEVATRLFPALVLSEDQCVALGHGKRPRLHSGQRLSDGSDHAAIAAAIAPAGGLLGLVEVGDGHARVVMNLGQHERVAVASGRRAATA